MNEATEKAVIAKARQFYGDNRAVLITDFTDPMATETGYLVGARVYVPRDAVKVDTMTLGTLTSIDMGMLTVETVVDGRVVGVEVELAKEPNDFLAELSKAIEVELQERDVKYHNTDGGEE